MFQWVQVQSESESESEIDVEFVRAWERVEKREERERDTVNE